MRHRQRTQNALSLVSYLFLFVGVIALTEMIIHAVNGAFRFNFGILGIGIFFGLRRYSRIWRTCALIFTWYSIITLSIALVVCLYSHPSGTGQLSATWLSIPLVMVLLVTVWQYRILTHRAVRRLFDEVPRAIGHAAETAGVPAGMEDSAVLK
jgi:hypothetical protein